MIYLLGWLFLYIAVIISIRFESRDKRVFTTVALLFIASVAVLRGEVGTDTAGYESMLLGLSETAKWSGLEPGFVVLGSTLTTVFGSSVIGVRAVSAVFFLLIFFFLIRSNEDEHYLLITYIAPAFIYSYSMNALRLGIASAILLLATQEARKHGFKSAFTVACFAMLFHYSIFLSIFFLILSQLKLDNLTNILPILVLVILMAAIFYFNIDYFQMKALSYQKKMPPSSLSGLSKVLVIFVFLTTVSTSKLPMVEKTRLVALGAGFTLCFWYLSRISYAGLRLLDLVSFAFPLAILCTYQRIGIKFDYAMKFGLGLAGLVAAAAVYRNFLLEAGLGKSPFIPYHFIGF